MRTFGLSRRRVRRTRHVEDGNPVATLLVDPSVAAQDDGRAFRPTGPEREALDARAHCEGKTRASRPAKAAGTPLWRTRCDDVAHADVVQAQARRHDPGDGLQLEQFLAPQHVVGRSLVAVLYDTVADHADMMEVERLVGLIERHRKLRHLRHANYGRRLGDGAGIQRRRVQRRVVLPIEQ